MDSRPFYSPRLRPAATSPSPCWRATAVAFLGGGQMALDPHPPAPPSTRSGPARALPRPPPGGGRSRHQSEAWLYSTVHVSPVLLSGWRCSPVGITARAQIFSSHRRRIPAPGAPPPKKKKAWRRPAQQGSRAQLCQAHARASGLLRVPPVPARGCSWEESASSRHVRDFWFPSSPLSPLPPSWFIFPGMIYCCVSEEQPEFAVLALLALVPPVPFSAPFRALGTRCGVNGFPFGDTSPKRGTQGWVSLPRGQF